ncbi:hypothetical protein AMTR_s00003p00181190 [Amborella trichopoda]|uniref:Uncharacterized protein n=1 Tax=Amborella trichopoda TaxID=13333 RepID=W1P8C9_AMBTC|nr:hypothetical protein AMTR_s00003p00181190 [Amborella trichopoda]
MGKLSRVSGGSYQTGPGLGRPTLVVVRLSWAQAWVIFLSGLQGLGDLPKGIAGPGRPTLGGGRAWAAASRAQGLAAAPKRGTGSHGRPT